MKMAPDILGAIFMPAVRTCQTVYSLFVNGLPFGTGFGFFREVARFALEAAEA